VHSTRASCAMARNSNPGPAKSDTKLQTVLSRFYMGSCVAVLMVSVFALKAVMDWVWFSVVSYIVDWQK